MNTVFTEPTGETRGWGTHLGFTLYYLGRIQSGRPNLSSGRILPSQSLYDAKRPAQPIVATRASVLRQPFLFVLPLLLAEKKQEVVQRVH